MSLNTGFQGLPISEVVPEAIAGLNEGLTKSSLLVSRRKIRFQPQTGTTATPGSIVQFVLADSSSLLDVNSATISFNVKATGAGVKTLDDGPSWCRRMQVSLNGNLVTDVDNAHRLANMEVYGSADKGWYQSAGSFAGYWKFNPDLVLGVAATAPTTAAIFLTGLQAYNPYFGDSGITAASGPLAVTGGAWAAAATRTISSGAGEDRIVPLSLLDGFFRCKQYIPLNLLGELVISFTLASASEAMLQEAGSTDASYTLSDIFMEVDVVQPHYALQELMTKVANSEGENGIVVPYEASIVSQGQSLTTGTSSVIVSRATNNLRRLLYVHQLTTGISSVNFASVSCFGFNAVTNWQARVGSLYFPSQPATTSARCYGLLQSTYGDAVNDKSGLANRILYTSTSDITGLSGNAKTSMNDMFIVGYNFDSYKNTAGTNVLDADGVSVLGQAGSQVVIQISQTGSVTPTVALMATRYLSLMNGSLKIIGV
jgi:hypothetical protein